jgi:phage-related tail fiber protein
MNLDEIATWDAGIYQIETEDLVQGGEGGVSNLQAKQLANRTQYLKQQLELKAAADHDHEGDYVTPEELAAVIPAGTVFTWASELAPAGFIPCEGAAVSRASYAALFAAIGIQYGNGDGATTFNLPDYRGQFLRGWDHGAGVDPDAATRTDRGDGTGGNVVGSKQTDAFESHTHTADTWDPSDSNHALFGGGTSIGQGPDASVNASGGNETRPKNINVLYIIKY